MIIKYTATVADNLLRQRYAELVDDYCSACPDAWASLIRRYEDEKLVAVLGIGEYGNSSFHILLETELYDRSILDEFEDD